MPYRFTFEGDTLDRVLSGEMEYADSIKELFPFWVRVKFNTIYNDNELKNDILEQVENYYNITVDKIYY